ncbi:MAG: ABC transporter ATP-binding protein [Alphaproteobacteria bacterium]
MLLRAENLTSGYGRISVLDAVSLEVDTGEVVAIIGPNGAGKSTVLRTLAGQLMPSAGRVRFDGQDVTRWDSARKAKAGLVFVPQGANIFARLTVRENLDLAGHHIGDARILRARIAALFARQPWMEERAGALGETLSGGQRQALALAHAMLLEPKLLLLDEPSLGLGPAIVEEVFAMIRKLNETGTTVLLVEQNARKALSIADRAYVLEQGKNALGGTGKDLLHDPQIQRLYLGG